MTHPAIYKRECSHVNNKLYFTNFIFNKIEKQSFFADTFFKWKIAFYFSFYHRYQWMILKFVFFSFSFCVFFTGQSGHTSRQFFPYVSSESDLQHYKTISFRHSHNHEHRASSSLSNVPSDFRSDRIKVCQKAHQFK